jgi:carotenoid 1,2-hydratase
MHVVLYGPGQQRWAMTERGTADLQQSAQSLVIGPSAMRWDGSMLTIDVDEVCTPIPRRLKGQIRLRVDRVYDAAWYLDPEQLHRWWPINPSAQLEVELEYPDIRWSGKGYFDCNDGKVPLENSFRYWNWSSAPLAAGGAAILYAVVGRDGQARDLALHYGANGTIGDFEPGSVVNLPSTRWGVKRQTHCHDTDRPRVIWSLVDSPFYSRSVLSTELMGEPVVAVHESLDLDRFVSPVVQKMLPFRVARKAG